MSDKSLTRIGSFLRKTKLDELPQAYNILRGELSLVGPRPCLRSQSELINERAKRGIFDIMPGITGWAQINGRNSISWEEKFKLDLWYVDNNSLYLDLKI